MEEAARVHKRADFAAQLAVDGREDGCDGIIAPRGGGQVAPNRAHVHAVSGLQLVSRRVRTGGVASIREDQVAAARGEQPGGGQPDAAGAAGDHGDAV